MFVKYSIIRFVPTGWCSVCGSIGGTFEIGQTIFKGSLSNRPCFAQLAACVHQKKAHQDLA